MGAGYVTPLLAALEAIGAELDARAQFGVLAYTEEVLNEGGKQ